MDFSAIAPSGRIAAEINADIDAGRADRDFSPLLIPGATVDIQIDIVRWHDDDPCPGVVECCLIDARSKRWTFIEKVPIVTEAMLGSDSLYPQPGVIRGIVVSITHDMDSRGIVTIDTTLPWDIEDIDGTSRFDVRPNQLTII